MTQDIKTAIKEAEKTLEQEKTTQLQEEIYDYLKSQLELIEQNKERKAFHQGQIRIYEENIKNVKAGNLEAIEKRRLALNANWPTITFQNTSGYYNGTGIYWYNANVAGTTITTRSGRTYIF